MFQGNVVTPSSGPSIIFHFNVRNCLPGDLA